jgi:hypothetical protein
MMLINSYMSKTKHISVRITEEFKQELHDVAKSKNTTISSLLVDSYNRVKNETKNLQRISS